MKKIRHIFWTIRCTIQLFGYHKATKKGYICIFVYAWWLLTNYHGTLKCVVSSFGNCVSHWEHWLAVRKPQPWMTWTNCLSFTPCYSPENGSAVRLYALLLIRKRKCSQTQCNMKFAPICVKMGDFKYSKKVWKRYDVRFEKAVSQYNYLSATEPQKSNTVVFLCTRGDSLRIIMKSWSICGFLFWRLRVSLRTLMD